MVATEIIKHIDAIPTIEPGRTKTAYQFKMVIEIELSDGADSAVEKLVKRFESPMPIGDESAETHSYSRARDHMWRIGRHNAEAKIREVFEAGKGTGEWGGLTALESLPWVTKL